MVTSEYKTFYHHTWTKYAIAHGARSKYYYIQELKRASNNKILIHVHHIKSPKGARFKTYEIYYRWSKN